MINDPATVIVNPLGPSNSVLCVCVCVCVFKVIPNRSINFDVNKQKRELIAQLECKNR